MSTNESVDISSDIEQARELADVIRTTWASELLRKRRPPNPHKYVYASGYRACDRRLVYDMKVPEQAIPFSADILANFNRGSDRGREIVIDLQRVGRAAEKQFEVFGQEERFELKDRNNRIVITGKTDASIRYGNLVARAEIKSWNPNLTNRIFTFADLFLSPWTKAGAFQLLSYLYGSGQPIGFMILDRPGLPRILPVVLYDWMDEMEEWLERATKAVNHLEAGTLPDYHKDPSECKRCPFYGWCSPPLKYEGAQVITDDDFIQLLEEREAVKTAGQTFNKLDMAIKKQLRGTEIGVAGPFIISGKWGGNTTYELPADIKEKYKKTDPKGKFTITITKVSDPVNINEGDSE